MRCAKPIILAWVAFALAGCALFGGERDPTVYPVSDAQADKILSDSMAEEFGAQSVHRLTHPYVGYRVEVGDEAILAIRVPAIGRGEDGNVEGFLFEVKLRGTPPVARAQALWQRILRNGKETAPPLPLVRRLD